MNIYEKIYLINLCLVVFAYTCFHFWMDGDWYNSRIFAESNAWVTYVFSFWIIISVALLPFYGIYRIVIS